LSISQICMRTVLPILLAGMSVSACSNTKWVATSNNAERSLYSDPGFGFQAMKGKTLAVGGMVLADGAALDEYCDIGVSRRQLTYEVQAGLWSPQLNSAVMNLTPEVEIQYWHTVQNAAPAELVEATHSTVAHHGIIKPNIMQDWAKILPEADYLALARIDNTWLDGTGQSDWSRAEGLGRVVVITLDICDLRQGRSVWSYEVQKHVWSRDSGAATGEKEDTGGMSGVEDHGTTQTAPKLQDALDDALDEVVKKLRQSQVKKK